MSVYDTMKFPSYTFREYPKWVNINGQDVIVNSQREELALIATTPEAAKDDPVVQEKNKLAAELAEAQEELAALRALKAQLDADKANAGAAAKKEPETVPPKAPAPETAKKG